MNGATTAQFLYGAYHTNLAQSVLTQLSAVIAAIDGVMTVVIAIYVAIIGKRMTTGAMSWDEGVTRLIRGAVVITLLGAANYQQFVATPITTTIPDFISNAVTGQNGLTQAQSFDALINQINNYTATARAQMPGFYYIPERLTVWLDGQMCGIVIICCFFIWCLANATADLLIPIGVFVLPFYLFDATREFAMRWVGKVISLFLVMAITLMVAQIVVYQDGQYIQTYAKAIAAAPPAAGFDQNPETNPANYPFGPTTPGGQTTGSINSPAALDNLANIFYVTLFGLFLMIICTSVALYIGGSSGFSAAPAINMISRGAESIAPRRG